MVMVFFEREGAMGQVSHGIIILRVLWWHAFEGKNLTDATAPEGKL